MNTNPLNDIALGIDVVRAGRPLVHCVTNYVTVNDCANALLAVDASPIMSHDPDDAPDITAICNALDLNIGTLDQRSIEGMDASLAAAADLGHPIVLDPVGAGASPLRTATATRLLDSGHIAIVRGNMSEGRALAQGSNRTRGVDVCAEDVVTEDTLAAATRFARDFSARTGAVAAFTGPIDIVADADRAVTIRNGSAWQGRITGAGCMLSALAAAFAAVHDDTFVAAAAAVAAMGVAGDTAARRMRPGIDGNATYRTYLIDALCNLTGEDVAARMDVRVQV